jgi:hypothetical protein
MPLRIHLLPTSCVLIPLANGYFKHLCTYQLKFTPRHSSYHYDYNKEKIIHKENITFLGKKQNEKVLNFTMLMIFIPVATPLLVPTTSTHKKQNKHQASPKSLTPS